ncbi:MAG: endonuclease domain-containing protein [Alphaproteobacteria bacterium]|jgi:adenine-specific DNA-methyltransferase
MDSFVRDLRSNPTDAERHLWYRLRLRQLAGFKFRRQRPIGPYVCDFICLEASLVIELDGSQHVAQMAYDSERDAFLRQRGYRVLRFWNHDVLTRTESVIDTIFEALQRPELDGRFD